MNGLRTWIEIDSGALRDNALEFYKLIPQKTRLMAVVKSNAYGHGLISVAKVLQDLPRFKREGWFGVDSIVEASRLRKEGISNAILVLGHTLTSRIPEAVRGEISLSVPSFEALKAVSASGLAPRIHLKIDTGMHRQGFMPEEIRKLACILAKKKIHPEGIYTHFATAKDGAYPTYTKNQIASFSAAIETLQKSGVRPSVRHASATGGTLLFPESHFDMVRIGMGLFGYWPSPESRVGPAHPDVKLTPVLSWKTIVAEVKKIPKNSFVGYDLTQRVGRHTTIAVLPIGYWHGYDRGLSSRGEVLIRGRRTRVLGRVSMDMIVVDVTDIPGVRPGNNVTLIGQEKKEAMWADDLARVVDTSPYEFLTRLNPLMKRMIV